MQFAAPNILFKLSALMLSLALLTVDSAALLAADKSFEELTADLRSPEAKTRRKAASELGKTGSREAVTPLLSATQDRDIGVREEAVKSLGLLTDERAMTMLLTTIKDPAPSVREESIIALVSLYVDRDAGFLITRLAKKVYKKINPFSDKVGNDPTVIESYVRVSPVVVESIADRLTDSDPAIRVDAAKALGILRAQSAIPRMLEAMKVGDANLRIAILRSLYKIRDPSVDEHLLPYLDDSDKTVRDETIMTLGLFRSRKTLAQLQKIYDENPDTKLRLKALQAISLVGDPSSLELFRRNLRDPDAAYRRYAAEGIARVGDVSVVEEVSGAFLQEDNTETQYAQSFALYRLGRKEYLEKLINGLTERFLHQQITSYFLEAGNPIAFELEKYLNHEDARVQERLCNVLGFIGDKSTIDKLKPLLSDQDSAVVSEAALAIRRLGAAS